MPSAAHTTPLLPSDPQLLGDLFTVIATHRLVNLTVDAYTSSEVPLHLYHFLEDGDYNWGKISFNITEKGTALLLLLRPATVCAASST